jgi:hypothetical protein
MDKYVVKIISHETQETVKEFEPCDETKAYRVENGASINLDHEKYFTVVEKA